MCEKPLLDTNFREAFVNNFEVLSSYMHRKWRRNQHFAGRYCRSDLIFEMGAKKNILHVQLMYNLTLQYMRAYIMFFLIKTQNLGRFAFPL